MNRPDEPPEPPERRTTPIPRQPQPPRPPAQPWYLEPRRPPPPAPQPPPRAYRPTPPIRRPPAPQGRPPPPAVPPAAPPPPNQVDAQQPANRALLIGAGITGLLALAVLVTLVLRVVVGGSAVVELDVTAAQEGVRQVLTDPINGYGRDTVTDVRCNNGVNPTVQMGSTFTCAVTVDGAQRQVRVEFSDDAGTYAVDRPR